MAKKTKKGKKGGVVTVNVVDGKDAFDTVAKKNGLLGAIIDEDANLKTETKFALQELRMRGYQWTAKFLMAETISEMHRTYHASFMYDTEPQEARIAQIEKELNDGLFAEDEQARNNAQKQIANIQKNMAEEMSKSPDIEGTIHVVELKYTDKGTQMVVILAADTVFEFATNLVQLKKYKAVLDPKFV